MRLISIMSLLCLFSSCTSYQTTRISKNRVMVAKKTTILAFWGGTVFTCKTNDDGIIQSCVENEIETEAEQRARAEREEKEKMRKQLNPQLSASLEAPKSNRTSSGYR